MAAGNVVTRDTDKTTPKAGGKKFGLKGRRYIVKNSVATVVGSIEQADILDKWNLLAVDGATVLHNGTFWRCMAHVKAGALL